MKSLYFILLVSISVLFFSCSAKKVNENQLVERKGIAYEINSEKPFTGVSAGEDFVHSIKYEINYTEGKINGKFTLWYINGQLKEESSYLNGELNGKKVTWYENGQKEKEINYVNGKKEGKAFTWYKNGQQETEMELSNNIPNGKFIVWYENGQKQAEGEYVKGNEQNIKQWYPNGIRYR